MVFHVFPPFNVSLIVPLLPPAYAMLGDIIDIEWGIFEEALRDSEKTDICAHEAPPLEDLAVKATAFMPRSITLLLSAWDTAWMLFPAPALSVVHDSPASTDFLTTPAAPTTKTTTPSKVDAP